MNMIDITPVINAVIALLAAGVSVAIEAAVNQFNGGNLPLE